MFLLGLKQIIHEFTVIIITDEDLLPVISPAGDMIKIVFALQSIWSGHELILPNNLLYCQQDSRFSA